MFNKQQYNPVQFNSRADAFNYMLNFLLQKNKDPLEAAQQADSFADLIAKNNALPDTTAPTPEGLDKYLQMLDKIGDYTNKHPKLLEYGLGALTFLAGIVTGNKIEQNNKNNNTNIDTKIDQSNEDNIDFNNLKD